jgi:hypothetical protein
MDDTLNSEALGQLQDEVIALVSAWADRGISPEEAAMVVAANAHMMLAKFGFSLGQIVAVMADGWRKSNGKL